MTLIPSLQPCHEFPLVLRETRRVCVELAHKVYIPLDNFYFITEHSDNLDFILSQTHFYFCILKHSGVYSHTKTLYCN